MRGKVKVSNIISVFSGMTFLFSFGANSTTFDFELKNYLEGFVKLSPAPIKDVPNLKSEDKDIIIRPSNSERKLPEIKLQGGSVSIATGETKRVSGEISEVDFSSVGLSANSSIVQRLQIVDEDNKNVAGYLSFRCSLYNITPVMTVESCSGYSISEEDFPFGGEGIISIKKDA